MERDEGCPPGAPVKILVVAAVVAIGVLFWAYASRYMLKDLWRNWRNK